MIDEVAHEDPLKTVTGRRRSWPTRRRLAASLALAGFAALFLFGGDDDGSTAVGVVEPRPASSAAVLRALSGTEPDPEEDNGKHTRSSRPTRPFVSFVVPTSLTRPTLNRTLSSLLDQSDGDWEAVVGIDVLRTAERTEEDRMLKASTFLRDDIGEVDAEEGRGAGDDADEKTRQKGGGGKRAERTGTGGRIRYVTVKTPHSDRGARMNGSGEVRNAIVREHARGHWVAMVDDDDTLGSRYVERMKEALEDHPDGADILLFRMYRPFEPHVLPPPEEGSKYKRRPRPLTRNHVGISFAVRRDLFLPHSGDGNGRGGPIGFAADAHEDYNFLKLAHTRGLKIFVTDFVGYFVRSSEATWHAERVVSGGGGNDPCRWEKVSVA